MSAILRSTLLLVALLVAPVAVGQSADPGLVFHFETVGPAGRGVLDLGRIAAEHDRRKRDADTVVRKRILVRLDGGAAAPASARVSVALAVAHSGVRVRIDGVMVSTLPTLIDPVHRIGTNVSHTVDVIVPRDVAPGPIFNDLLWIAETD